MLPSPGVLSTRIQPPIMCTSCEVMARPSPVPPNLRVVCKAHNLFLAEREYGREFVAAKIEAKRTLIREAAT